MIEDKSLLKIDELYEKYNLECSRKAIFNEISKDKDKRKSFFYRNIFKIEFLLVLLVSVAIIAGMLLCCINKISLIKLNNRILTVILVFALLLLLIVMCTFILLLSIVIVINVGQNILKKRMIKKYNITIIEKDDKKKLVTFKFENKINKIMNMILENKKEMFIKENLIDISRDNLLTIYQFVKERKENINRKISEKSNMKIAISVTTIVVTLLMSKTFEKFEVIEIILTNSIYFYIFLVFLFIFAFAIYKMCIVVFELIEHHIFLNSLIDKRNELESFSNFLEEIILNYNKIHKYIHDEYSSKKNNKKEKQKVK